MQKETNVVVWTVVVGVILACILLGGFYVINGKVNDASAKVGAIDTKVNTAVTDLKTAATNLANTPASNVNVDVPTAKEIAAEIDMPDTVYSIRDKRKAIATDLAQDELDERDFRDDLADYISNNCGSVDIDRLDITDIKVRETDYQGGYFTTITVTYELKVYFDNFGDEDEAEWSRVEVDFVVTNLDYDDDFEDAEVASTNIVDMLRCSTD
jgi:hypothetical protein